MNERSQTLFLILASTALALFMPGPALTQTSAQMWNTDRATSEREWSSTRKPPLETITFSWVPELDPLTTLYFVRARCDIDNKKAKNKVSFGNVQLTSVTSNKLVKLARASRPIRQGEGKTAFWDLTPLVPRLLTDDTVLVSGEVKTKKKLKAHQAMTCSLSVWELFDEHDLRLGTASERLGFFAEFSETMERDRSLPRVLSTGQTEVFAAGDDGDLKMGVSCPKPRFTVNGDGTVTDNLTGLIWLQDANCPEDPQPWEDALAWSSALFDGCTSCGGAEGDCGLSDGSVAGDWRLPNRYELESLMDLSFWNPALSNAAGTAPWAEGDAFYNVESWNDEVTGRTSYYSTSTTLAEDSGLAWFVNPFRGEPWIAWKTHDLLVWPVRGGQ